MPTSPCLLGLKPASGSLHLLCRLPQPCVRSGPTPARLELLHVNVTCATALQSAQSCRTAVHHFTSVTECMSDFKRHITAERVEQITALFTLEGSVWVIFPLSQQHDCMFSGWGICRLNCCWWVWDGAD